MPPQPSAISPLDAHVGYWLRCVSNQVSHTFGQKLAALEVTVAEWVLLRTLYELDGAAPSLLADSLGMTRGAISKLAERLVAKGLIVRAAGAGDRRFQSLALTTAGRELTPRLAALADQNDHEFFGHLEPSARAELESLLREMVRRHGSRVVPID